MLEFLYSSQKTKIFKDYTSIGWLHSNATLFLDVYGVIFQNKNVYAHHQVYLHQMQENFQLY